jgi:hypothetical protein
LEHIVSDETAIGSAETSDSGGHSGRGRSEPASLQSRAKFLENWSRASVAEINGGLCDRGKAQRGLNSETHTAVGQEWEKRRTSELTLLETFEFLKSCHRRAPFLFFNGNTFAEIGRALGNALFFDLPLLRRKETSSAVAHFITGVLNLDMMIDALESLSLAAAFAPGDHVKTLRGSRKGIILRILSDRRVVWKPDGSTSKLLASPESLLRK